MITINARTEQPIDEIAIAEVILQCGRKLKLTPEYMEKLRAMGCLEDSTQEAKDAFDAEQAELQARRLVLGIESSDETTAIDGTSRLQEEIEEVHAEVDSRKDIIDRAQVEIESARAEIRRLNRKLDKLRIQRDSLPVGPPKM